MPTANGRSVFQNNIKPEWICVVDRVTVAVAVKVDTALFADGIAAEPATRLGVIPSVARWSVAKSADRGFLRDGGARVRHSGDGAEEPEDQKDQIEGNLFHGGDSSGKRLKEEGSFPFSRAQAVRSRALGDGSARAFCEGR